MLSKEIHGERVSLLPYTKERCTEFFEQYVTDPSMTAEEYRFSLPQVLRYHQKVSSDPRRRMFAICVKERCIGEISLKDLDLGAGCATLSVAICSEEYRNRGFGSEAQMLLLRHAFGHMGLKVVFADAAKSNSRSRHVLEKLGFCPTHQRGASVYYRLSREDLMLK